MHVGQQVRFDAKMEDRGPRAVRVEPGRRGLSPGKKAGAGLAVCVIAMMAVLWKLGLPAMGIWLGAINPPTFAIYAWDKYAAGAGRRRIPEAVLLGLALIGGSPGALLAMLWLRHKTKKPSFLIACSAIVIVQIAVIGWWFLR